MKTNTANYWTRNLFRKVQYLSVMLVFLCIGSVVASAQTTVRGSVTDENGSPLVGVSVSTDVNGKKTGTATDLDGNYSISVQGGATLTFSFIGYLDETVNPEERTDINVSMKPDTKLLDESVVIGYGTVKKKDILGSVSTVREQALDDRTTGNVIESMRGLTSGMKITSSGQPGSNASIVIRGLGSLTNNSPLFIVDGNYGGSEVGLNVEDIESIQVLKDASSAAIYGSRAANGVVIITTKKGTKGGLKVKFDSNVELNWLPRYDLMDAETYKLYDDRAYAEAMLQGVEGVTGYQNHFEANTDWQDEMLSMGVLQNYNISLSGGSDDIRYYTSLNRMVDDGALYGTGYDKYGFRVNTSGRKGIFEFGENFFYTRSSRDNMGSSSWSNFITMPPTIPVYDANNPGGYGYGSSDRANTYALNPVAQENINESVNDEEYMYGNIFGQINLFKDVFKAKLNLAYKSYYGITNKLRKKGNWTMGQGDDAASVSSSMAKHHDILIEHTYTFDKTFGKHDVDAMLGMSYNRFHEETRSATKLDPLTVGDKYITSISAATGTTSATGGYTESALISYLGRINYAYADKYLVQITARRDGTSKLPQGNKWGNFYSGSVGWRISSEDFFDVPAINDLKIRANYGVLGNTNIGVWDYQSTINTAPRAVLGASDKVYVGMTQSNLTNNDLVWESKTTANVGIDMTAFRSRFTVAAEWFLSKSEDLLVYLPILWTTGNEGGAPATNAGSLQNTGVELELGWNDRKGDFSYAVNLNLSHVRNKVLSLGYGQTVYYTGTSISEIGKPLGMWYLYEMDGIFQSKEEVVAHQNSEGKIIQPNALPGDIRYVDYDDDGQIASTDRHIVGSPWPWLEMGLGVNLAYKGFALNLSGYGRFGQTVFNGARATAGDFNTNQNNFNGLKPWTQENPSTTHPRIIYGDTRNSRNDQDRWLEDGSFFRFSDISLSYSLPSSLISKIGFEQIKVSVIGKNLVTFTKYSGLDPEFADGGIYTLGYDGCSFPNPRSVSFGLTFTF